MLNIALNEVNRLFAAGIIERSESDYSNSLVMIWKLDGTYRFCLFFVRLRSKTVYDALIKYAVHVHHVKSVLSGSS